MHLRMIFAILFLSTYAQADESYWLTVHEKELEVPLAEDFCEISDTAAGHFLRFWLDNALEGQVKVALIFADCAIVSEIDHSEMFYPWGYIGTLPFPAYTPPQAEFNKMMATNTFSDHASGRVRNYFRVPE